MITAQDEIEIDPEVMELMGNYQEQNENIPIEMLALMPSELEVSKKTWMVEPSTNMMLTVNLESTMNNTQLENTESYQLNLRISMTSYNMKSYAGKMMADQSLDSQRQEAQDSWVRVHPESSGEILKIYQPEKIVLSQGYILIQKTYSPAHEEGEGMVAERTTYAGFLYMDVENGFLTAEVQTVPNTKVGIEKWLRHIGTSALKLDIEKYF